MQIYGNISWMYLIIYHLQQLLNLKYFVFIVELCWNQAYRPRVNPPYIFGYDITEKFNRDNKLNMIIRGHELDDKGYSWCHYKQTLTIFSGHNYAYRFGNKAAIIEFDEYLKITILQFSPNPIKIRKDQNNDFNRRIPDYFI